jgi:cytochrome c biogenesis protein CcmG/thiol:disulfide interchange protein DsbE
MSRRRLTVALLTAAAVTAGAGLLSACGGSASGAGEAAAVLAPPTADPTLVTAAGLDPCPSVGGGSAATLPDAPLPCLGAGPPVRMSALGGMPTVVNVWATWCGPCRAELPHFQWLHATAGDRVRVLGVLYEDDPDAGLAFAKKLGVRFPSVVDGDGELKKSGAVGLPATFFVAGDGTTTVKLGEVNSRAELRDLVAERLGISL